MSESDITRLMIQNLIKGLEEAKNSLQSLQSQVHANELNSVEVGTQLKNISKEVVEMIDLMRGNNGKQSILERVSKLENDHARVAEYLNNQKEIKEDREKGSLQLKIAIVTSSAGIITAIGTVLYNILM
jgi:hypothetical protein